jgi:hypothetical protein
VGGLWTPSGEHVPQPSEPDAGGRLGDEGAGLGDEGEGPPPSAEEIEAMRRLHAELRAAPVEAVIANHAVGLLQLALLQLGLVGVPDTPPPPPDLVKAGLAIDALACLVDGLGNRLGEHEEPLREALSQAQMAYVEVAEAVEG